MNSAQKVKLMLAKQYLEIGLECVRESGWTGDYVNEQFCDDAVVRVIEQIVREQRTWISEDLQDWGFECTTCTEQEKTGLGPLSAKTRAVSHAIKTGHHVAVMMDGVQVDEEYFVRDSGTLDTKPPY